MLILTWTKFLQLLAVVSYFIYLVNYAVKRQFASETLLRLHEVGINGFFEMINKIFAIFDHLFFHLLVKFSALVHSDQDIIGCLENSKLDLLPEQVEKRVGLIGIIVFAVLDPSFFLLREERIEQSYPISSTLVIAHFTHEQ